MSRLIFLMIFLTEGLSTGANSLARKEGILIQEQSSNVVGGFRPVNNVFLVIEPVEM